MKTRAASLLIGCVCAGVLLACQTAMGGQNMIGRQSQNEGLSVVPAPGKVTVDGDLSDWDWSGRIWIFADTNVRSRFSVEVAAMWDKDSLYLAAKWKDPTPMFSAVNPEFNPEEGWKSDSWQLRVKTDRICHLTTWYFTAKKMPAMHVSYEAKGMGGFVLFNGEGPNLGKDVAMAYRKDADGKGYTQEIRVPWSLIWGKVPEIKPGLVFRLGNELLWGDPTGKTWPIHRYADNMQSGATSREFYWTNTNAWGDAELLEKGNLPVRQYVSDEGRLAGTLPVRVTIAKAAASFTLAINDAKGKRIRNLAGAFTPEDYTVETKGDTRVVEVMWDCLDDQGKPAPTGEYQVVGLTHGGLGAEYDRCFYDPGTPPWATPDGTGAWGADHAGPHRAAASADWVILACPGVEGGSGIFGIGPDGLKKWGEKRAASVLAADEQFVYAIANSWYVNGALCRFGKTNGSNQPFTLQGKPRPFELTLKDIFGAEQPGEVTAIAASNGNLLLAMSTGKLAVLDAASATVQKTLTAGKVTALAFGPAGRLYAVREGVVQAVDVAAGTLTPVATPGLGAAAAIAVDPDGNIVIADSGADSQVKAYTPDGKTAYTIGKKGGRAIRGSWDPTALRQISSVAVDANGRVWVVENCEYPRRVSVWIRDGNLIRDYIGNTGYAGTDCWLHDEDPSLAYAGPVEIKLNRESNSWSVTQVLWVPDLAKGERFDLSPHSAGDWGQSSFTTSAASGRKISYLYSYKGPSVVFMKRGEAWQPVAAICLVEHVNLKEFADLNPKDGLFWNDTNKDGKISRDECVVVKGGLKIGSYWCGQLGQDLSIFGDGIVKYSPTGFTDDGAPIYGPAGMKDLGTGMSGGLMPITQENLLLCLSYNNYPSATPGLLGIDSNTGDIRWSYPNPYPGVHGSHRATMPKPGLMIGAMKICGVARVSEPIGNVCLVRGNLGQDFLFTSDGLYVAALFQDGRLPGEALPNTEAALKGMPMEGFTEGGEPFNGWFGKQSDGKTRLTTGMAREAAMVLEVKGLETIRRFQGPKIAVDAATLVKAEHENAARLATVTEPKRYAIKPMARAPKTDGDPAEWAAIPALAIERENSPNKGALKMAYDGANLYVLFDVKDASPWRNEGKDFTRLFKTGDAVDLQLCTDPSAPARRNNVLASDVRLVFSQFGGKPVVVLMKPVDPNAPADKRVKHSSPVGAHTFDRIQILDTAQMAVKTEGTGYRVEAAIPLKEIGLAPHSGMTLRGDAGIISSDARGLVNVARTYWSNKATNLVNDLPSEAWLYPETWGELRFE